MRPFTYVRASDEAAAVSAGQAADVQFLAGGTTLVDLMRLDVMRPRALVDLGGLALAAIEDHDGRLRIGAMARNEDVARDRRVVERYPALAEALLAGASPQVRHMATVGGNLLQRTRCPYFRDVGAACNKREPGSGCSAIGGYTRSHAILGGSERCIATHPSDMCVALVALDAVVHARGPGGARAIPIGEFHTRPGDHPETESVLGRGELITHVELPASKLAARSRYVKVRDRAAFAFALASAAVCLDLGGGRIREARVALGGVATVPWRAAAAEQILAGQAPGDPLYARAAAAALQGAAPREHNAFKVELARRTIVRALRLAAGAP
jgi:xanthine dehydrogenase YagS FAD-binding subunit